MKKYKWKNIISLNNSGTFLWMKCIWLYICGKLIYSSIQPYILSQLISDMKFNKKATHCASFTVFSERTNAAKFNLWVKAKWLWHYVPALILLQFTYEIYCTWTVWDADRFLYDLIDMIESSIVKLTQSQYFPDGFQST